MVLIKVLRHMLAIVLSIAFTTSFISLSWSQDSPPVRISLVPFLGEAPAYIAAHNGYFQQEGLEVAIKYNPAGKVSLKDLFDDKLDIISVADTPLVYKGFSRNDFYIVAGMSHTEHLSGAVARKDKGVDTPSGIKGRKVAWFQGTGTDYLLDQYLLSQGLSYSDIQAVDLKPKALEKELLSGNVDAIFSWHPHISNVVKALGDKAYILPTTGLKVLDWVVVTKKEYAEKNPENVERYLRAIAKANQFIRDQTSEAMMIYSKESGSDMKIVTAMWNQFSYGLYLNEPMLINMEDQARWIIRTKEQASKKVPNFLDLFNTKLLQKVKPEVVTLIK